MSETKRIMVSLPRKLLTEVDQLIQEENGSRSKFVREAMQMYITEKKRQLMRERLREGYQRMATINLILAEEGSDEELLESYERELAEAE